ncbi:MAG: phosphatase PAP2 family protein [Planctomycetia bacterium]
MTRSKARRRRLSSDSGFVETQPLEVRMLLAAAVDASAGLIHDWNEVLLQAIRVERPAPPVASRAMAIVSTSMFEAVNSLDGRYESLTGLVPASSSASPEAALAVAARDALAALFPGRTAVFDAALSASLAGIPEGEAKAMGIQTGTSAAKGILDLRSGDGSATPVQYTIGDQPGEWVPTAPAFAAAVLPQWPNVTPWTLTSPDQFRPKAPPSLKSSAYARALNEVQSIGSATSTTRTEEQTAIARFWAGSPGTVTPPGQWNVIAQGIAKQSNMGLLETAHLYAVLDMALADAAIVCWDAKYEFELWRPISAIRSADQDQNSATTADPGWTSLLTTPAFPSYTSGHSTFSSAGATVMARLLGTDTISFPIPAEVSGIAARSFSSFSAAAEEAGMSRIYGGIHFSFDNTEGQRAGRRLGEYVVDTVLPMKSATLVTNNQLEIRASDKRDSINVESASGKLRVVVNGKLTGTVPQSFVNRIVIYAGAGNDTINISNRITIPAVIHGGAGNDDIYGGGGGDQIFGDGGNDVLFGRDGDDWLYGGYGSDRLDGQNGRDHLFGEEGSDVLVVSRKLDLFSDNGGRNRIIYR